MTERHSFVVNGAQATADVPGATPLIHVLRNDLGLTSARFGCGEGGCGACTVLIDGRPEHSCDVSVEFVAGRSVETVEGLSRDGVLHPLQKAFLDEQAGQCGYCLTGILMRAKALLDANPSPTRTEIAGALDGNLCRCGAHPRILRAVARAAEAIRASRT
jgi:nicotinate dehydrogenase subunit A